MLSLNTGKYLNHSTSMHSQAGELMGLPGLAIRDKRGAQLADCRAGSSPQELTVGQPGPQLM